MGTCLVEIFRCLSEWIDQVSSAFQVLGSSSGSTILAKIIFVISYGTSVSAF